MAMGGDGPIHIHVAEQVKEIEDCLAWSGARPVRWLMDHAPVDQRWCLIHATHMDPQETLDVARSGAIAGLCPITEANLGDGLFPTPSYLTEGGRFGIGSDSNIDIGVAAELRQLEYAQRLARRERNVLADLGGSTAARLFSAAARGGAQALKRDAGRLAPGARADIVALDANSSWLVGREGDASLDAWIFAAGNRAVDCVWSSGRKLVIGGRHVARGAIEARFVKTMRGLMR